MKSAFKLMCALCVFATSLTYGQSQIVIDTDEFHYTATFDSSRISEGRLRELLLLSPYDFSSSATRVEHEEVIIGSEENASKLRKGPIAYWLEVCVDADPRYRPCGTRDISDTNFLANARINLDRNQQILAALNRFNVPTELKSILQQFRDSMEFYDAMESRRPEYLQTGDLGILSRPIANLDPSQICSKEIGELKEAATLQRRYELSRHEWHECLNSEWDRLSPTYPKAAWSSFLHAFGISERYTNKPID